MRRQHPSSTLFPYTTLFRSMLTKPIKGCSELKSWAMRIARRAGTNKAKVALARKLAVIMLDRKSARLNSSHLGISYAALRHEKQTGLRAGPHAKLSPERTPP